MALSASELKALDAIEREMARKGFRLGEILRKQIPVVFTSNAAAGGGASEALTVTGLKATDTILSVQHISGGTATVAVTGWNTQVTDGLTVQFAIDPGAGALVQVVVQPA